MELKTAPDTKNPSPRINEGGRVVAPPEFVRLECSSTIFGLLQRPDGFGLEKPLEYAIIENANPRSLKEESWYESPMIWPNNEKLGKEPYGRFPFGLKLKNDVLVQVIVPIRYGKDASIRRVVVAEVFTGPGKTVMVIPYLTTSTYNGVLSMRADKEIVETIPLLPGEQLDLFAKPQLGPPKQSTSLISNGGKTLSVKVPTEDRFQTEGMPSTVRLTMSATSDGFDCVLFRTPFLAEIKVVQSTFQASPSLEDLIEKLAVRDGQHLDGLNNNMTPRDKDKGLQLLTYQGQSNALFFGQKGLN